MKPAEVRQRAAQVVAEVLRGQSLARALPAAQAGLEQADRALLADLSYGAVRHAPKLQALLQFLLARPFKPKQARIEGLLLVGGYQLLHTRIPRHAAVHETVAAAAAIDGGRYKALVNGVLRNLDRQHHALTRQLETRNPAAAAAHPEWLYTAIRNAWPMQAPAILEAGNLRPPMTLRINTSRCSVSGYHALLDRAEIAWRPGLWLPQAIRLSQPVAVDALPGFSDGWVSVQDESAQLATTALRLGPGMRVLDACAAPGGKAAAMLEAVPDLHLTAIDLDADRLARVDENLSRTGGKATLQCGDVADPDSWWDGVTYDRILLDAPCSATGVIRRHPDIKLLRRATDIPALAATQTTMLHALWPLLRPGGELVYATCSLLPEENLEVVRTFVQAHPEAAAQELPFSAGIALSFGRQILPEPTGNDGFYYVSLRKPV